MDRMNMLWNLSLITFLISDAYLFYSGIASSNSQILKIRKSINMKKGEVMTLTAV